jgi:hypothetical protein
MRSKAVVHGYRGTEYSVHEEKPGEWRWRYYPKKGEGMAKSGQVKGTREMAIAACQAAIDEWLGPETSN